MTCDEAKARVDALADGELESAREAEVRAHLETCAACSAELRAVTGLDALLKRADRVPVAPPGLAESASRRARVVPRRPRSMIPLTMAAGVLAVMAGLQLFAYSFESALSDLGSGRPEARERAVAWADRQGEALVAPLSAALRDRSVERQRRAAELTALLRSDPVRQRVVSAQEPAAEAWELSSIGTEVSDVELVGYAAGLARSEKTAREGLQILARLDQGGLNRMAHREIIAQARELLASGQEADIRAAFRILERLNILVADLVEFIDVPDLGPKALEFLKRRSGKDFGTDKAAWRAWFESRKG